MIETLQWVMGLELPTGGIAAYKDGPAYPEVSGYLIPTLYDYGQPEAAIRIADWLLTIQGGGTSQQPQAGASKLTPESTERGWFPDMRGMARAFDTGACMEGLGRAFQETQDPRYQEAATRAWDWLESMELEDGSLRTAPGSQRTHLYMLRVAGLMGNDRPVKAWIEKAWDLTRTHYVAYALEGLWMLGETGFVIAQLLLARKAITPEGLMPYEAGASWKDCKGTDTCATAQMAILYRQAGMEEDAQRLRAGVEKMVQPDGGIRLGLEHKECNTWTAKWYLDMETTIK